MYTMEFYSAMNKDEIMSFVDHHVKQNKPNSQRQISHVLFHMRDLDL
jgi:hypothetical protein